mgnify:CR=1 FL=1
MKKGRMRAMSRQTQPPIKSIHFILSAGFLLLLSGLPAANGADSALTMKTDPIGIDSIEELQLIGNDPAYPLDGSYILTQDIDASATAAWNDGEGFDPIGNYDEANLAVSFTGQLDGQRYVIRNLNINRPNEDNVGLFSAILEPSALTNLGLEQCKIVGRDNVGGLLGFGNCSIITASYVAGAITGSENVGGLLGYAGDCLHISQCYAQPIITGIRNVGGLMGQTAMLSIHECYVVGVVSGITNIGGLFGCSDLIQMEDCYVVTVLTGRTKGNCCGEGDQNIMMFLQSVFYDMDVSGLPDGSIYEINRTTAAMMQAATYINSGWDFTTEDGDPAIWTILEGQTYPHFIWSAPSDVRYFLSATAEHGSFNIEPNQSDYAPFSLIWLTAEADTGYRLAGWTGSDFGDIALQDKNPLPVIMGSNREIRAIFIPDRPIAIYSIEDLQKIGRDSEWPLNWDYVVEEDLDASITTEWNGGAGFQPIGRVGFPFSGIIEGNGHVIRNLVVNMPQESYIALLGYIDEAGEVRNLALKAG